MDPRPDNTNAFVHSGRISEIRDRSIVVALDEDVHCESCRAKAVCGVSRAASKEIEVPYTSGSFKLQEPVEVVLRKDLGHKAVFWAYIFPFLLMLLTLLTASVFLSEWMAGLMSLLVLVPYYLIVYGLKNYFEKTFRVSILSIS